MRFELLCSHLSSKYEILPSSTVIENPTKYGLAYYSVDDLTLKSDLSYNTVWLKGTNLDSILLCPFNISEYFTLYFGSDTINLDSSPLNIISFYLKTDKYPTIQTAINSFLTDIQLELNGKLVTTCKSLGVTLYCDSGSTYPALDNVNIYCQTLDVANTEMYYDAMELFATNSNYFIYPIFYINDREHSGGGGIN